MSQFSWNRRALAVAEEKAEVEGGKKKEEVTNTLLPLCISGEVIKCLTHLRGA